MKKSSLLYNIFQQSSHSSTAFQASMSSFIYHILLSLTDLSLIYSCRLHDQSSVMSLINLHISCILRDQEICLSTTQLINLHTSCMLCDGGICIPTGHAIDPPTYQPRGPKRRNLPTSYTIDQSTYQLAPWWGICWPATQLINLHTSCILRDRAICLLAM